MNPYLVCGRWPLPLVDGTGGHFAHLTRKASTWNEWCFQHIICDVPTGLNIVEYFGGVGIFATIVQECLRPRQHLIYDLDRDCVRQLVHAFRERVGILIARGDAKERMGRVDADMVVLDFPTSNVRAFERDWPIAAVMKRKPRYLIWSDTAMRRIGWHRRLYADFFGQPVASYDDYIRCFNEHLWQRYGYTITRVTRHVYAYYLAQPLPHKVAPIVTRLGR